MLIRVLTNYSPLKPAYKYSLLKQSNMEWTSFKFPHWTVCDVITFTWYAELTINSIQKEKKPEPELLTVISVDVSLQWHHLAG